MSSVFIITIPPPSSLRVTTISSLSRNNFSTWRFAWEMLYLGFCHIPVVLIVRSMCLRKPLMESSAGSMSRGAAMPTHSWYQGCAGQTGAITVSVTPCLGWKRRIDIAGGSRPVLLECIYCFPSPRPTTVSRMKVTV